LLHLSNLVFCEKLAKALALLRFPQKPIFNKWNKNLTKAGYAPLPLRKIKLLHRSIISRMFSRLVFII